MPLYDIISCCKGALFVFLPSENVKMRKMACGFPHPPGVFPGGERVPQFMERNGDIA